MRQQKTVLRQNSERLFPELRQVFKEFTGQTALALLQCHADPHVIAALSWEEFEAGVRQELKGNRLMVKKLRQVYELAPHSIGLRPGGALQRLIQQTIATLSFQQQQVADLERELVALFHTLPHASYMLSLGLGEVATASIAAELGDPSRFSSAKQWVKLAGIQPSTNQSGQYERQKTPMSHKGRTRLRTYLFFATMRLIRCDPAFQAKHQALISRTKRPLERLEAVGALMNKLVHLLWAVCQKQTAYSPELFAQTT
jgi:transposase